MTTTKITTLQATHRRLCVAYGDDLGLVSSTATTATFDGGPFEVLARALKVHEAIATRQRAGQPGFAFTGEPGTAQSYGRVGSLQGGDYQIFGAVLRRLRRA